MAAAQQNYTIEQGQTFASLITIQNPGVPLPSTGTTALNSTSITSVGANLSSMTAGLSISGPGIPTNAIITLIAGTTLTISSPCTAAGTGVAIIVGAQVPVNLTGITFLFTAKTSKTLADTDPTTIKFNWTETSTPLLGQTFLQLSDTQTAGMSISGPQPQGGTNPAYFYQVWMYQAPSLTPVLEGVITVTQSVSTRFS